MNVYKILDSVPDPWHSRFLVLITTLAAAAVVVAALRSGGTGPVTGVAALIAVLLATLGALRLHRAGALPSDSQAARPFALWGYLLLTGALLIALATLSFVWKSVLEWIAVILPFLIILLCRNCFRSESPWRMIVIPLLLGLALLDTAILTGVPGAGGYPAVFAFFLSLILLSTRRLEHRVRAEAGTDLHYPVPYLHRRSLAVISTLFFFFGVVTLWPWLGKLYSNAYLWILIIGVLSPTLFLWGRLKQPRSQSPVAALVRFNRLLPYIGLILLLAILVG